MGISTRRGSRGAQFALAVSLALSAWAAAAAAAAAAPSGEPKIEVITSPEHRQQAGDPVLVRGLFTLRVTHWPDGAPVQVFVLPDDSPVHRLFCREWLGTYPYVLRTLWNRKVFTGTGLAPTLVDSEDEMRRRVLAARGAIGYVSRRVED
jgi:hypothetical protein